MVTITAKTHLWRKVEAQVASTSKTVFNKQWNLLRQAQLDSTGKTTSLAEVDKILEREGKVHGLGQLNGDVVVGLLDVGVRSQCDGSATNVSLAGEADTLFASFNADCGRLLALFLVQSGFRRVGLPDSDIAIKSLQIFWNSALGISMVAAYSVSGIPKCS